MTGVETGAFGAIALLIVVVAKTVAAYGLVRVSGYGTGTATTVSAALAQIGEFSFILAGLGVSLAILPKEGRDLIIAASILSILMSPLLFAALDFYAAKRAKRREETAATRSLLNTARLMEENPTLMRLKELETLEKVTEKIDKLTVFGGLDGVLRDVVRIQVPQS